MGMFALMVRIEGAQENPPQKRKLPQRNQESGRCCKDEGWTDWVAGFPTRSLGFIGDSHAVPFAGAGKLPAGWVRSQSTSEALPQRQPVEWSERGQG